MGKAMLGEVFNGYRVEALLGEGGIGQVYAAEHLGLGRQVALKVLLEEHADTPQLRKRFEREAKVLAGLSHPHIVSISDVGVRDDGMLYLVMELLEGSTLASYLEAHAVEPEAAISIMSQVLSAMAYAHEKGIAHRDLKPQNIFVQSLCDGSLHVTVLDFGLVGFVDEGLRKGTKLTRKGAVLGTPAYMAPEQAAGGEADGRADVYAAGLILFESLAGRRPFTSKNANELRRAHLTEPAPPLSQADPGLEVHDALEELLERALAKSADDRFADAQEMLGALASLPQDAARRIAPQQRVLRVESSTPDATAATLAVSPQARAMPRTREGSVFEPAQVNAFDATPAAPAALEPESSEPHFSSSPQAPSPQAHSPQAASPMRAQVPANPNGTNQTWLLVALAVGGVGFVLLGGFVAGVFIHFSDDEPSVESAALESEAAENPSPQEEGGEQASLPAPRELRGSPFSNLPAELQPLYAKLEAGDRLSRAEIGVLNRYGRAHPEDARSRLLLGRHFTAARSLTYAFPQYQEALTIDPTVRAWPPLLEDLLEMVRSRSFNRRAATLIAEVYGTEASPAIRAQLAVQRRRPETRRLERLLEHLEEGG